MYKISQSVSQPTLTNAMFYYYYYYFLLRHKSSTRTLNNHKNFSTRHYICCIHPPSMWGCWRQEI